jgi:hypothetical protein
LYPINAPAKKGMDVNNKTFPGCINTEFVEFQLSFTVFKPSTVLFSFCSVDEELVIVT